MAVITSILLTSCSGRYPYPIEGVPTAVETHGCLTAKQDPLLADPERYAQQGENGFNPERQIRSLGAQNHLAAGAIKAQNIGPRIFGLP